MKDARPSEGKMGAREHGPPALPRAPVLNGHDRDWARDALRCIDPGCTRDEWVHLAMSSKVAGIDFDTFNAWSAQAPNYGGERDTRSMWDSFKRTDGIGPGTLLKAAVQAGWTPPGRSVSPGPAKAPARPVAPTKAPRLGKGAAEVWGRCKPATEAHPYIVAKQGRPDGLRVVPDGDPLCINGESVAGCLVVPVVPLAGGDPVSLQFIPPPGAGKKLNLPGAPMAGVFIVGELVPGGSAYVCEGIGQAWACWKATGAAAVVCFGWGRVRAVAAELRQRDASARLVLVPDGGKEEDAEVIALEVGAELVTMPDGSPPNFDANDYAQAEGHDALELLLAGARLPQQPEPPPPPWRVVRVDDLATASIPAQAWAWRDYIPAEEVTLLGAHGGTGKSTLALMLGASVALGLPLFSVDTLAAPVVFYSAEDGADTVRRRLQAIVRGLGLDVSGLAERFDVLDATDAPELAALLPEPFGKPGFGLTVAGQCLKDYMADRPGSLLIVDNASDTMGGNENARAEVRAFVRLLAGMVRNTGGAVLLLAHVDKGTSRGDRAGGESYSGSTAWHNSARSRLYLSREKDSGALLLEHQKSNHGPMREPLRLVWPRDGLPELDAPSSGIVQHIEERNHLRAILRLVHEFTQRGEFVSTATTGPCTAAQYLRHSKGYPTRMQAGEVFELLRGAERHGLLQRTAYANQNRKPRERWDVTPAGLESAGIPAVAQVAQVAQVDGIGATGATGNLSAQVAQVPALGGVGGTNCAATGAGTGAEPPDRESAP